MSIEKQTFCSRRADGEAIVVVVAELLSREQQRIGLLKRGVLLWCVALELAIGECLFDVVE
jgi:hypothetical protein